MKKILFLFFPLTFTFCQQPDRRDEAIALKTGLFHEPTASALIEDTRLVEASGLIVSVKNPGFLWTHNDSGGEPSLYLIDKNANVKMVVTLEGFSNTDWEEIAMVDTGNIPYILIGEFGDNQGVRDTVAIVKIEEPEYNRKAEFSVPNDNIEEMRFTYAEGPRDSEAFFYDYNSDKLVLISKREENVNVYEFEFQPASFQIIRSLGTIPFRNFTSADMNKKGEILLKNYDSIFYWEESDLPASKRILNTPQWRVPYNPEPQGEAICWDGDGNFYSISEKNKGLDQLLIRYERK